MIRSPLLHELLAVTVVFVAIGGGLTVALSPKERSAASAATPQTPTAPPPSLVVANVKYDRTDPVQRRIYADYGAVFVARNGAVPPPSVVFSTFDEVAAWQAGVPTRRVRLGTYEVELQAPAMDALLAAREELRASRRDLTARAADASRRGYADTVKLWSSRVDPALRHWVKKGRLTTDAAKRIRGMAPVDQVPEVLALEKTGIYFSTDFSKSILYSVAAPGTSQHLSMLALDVAEFDDPVVRAALARHGWFQTVVSDLPHFTYLGVAERELPALGLRRVVSNDRPFWVPDLTHD